MSFRLDDRTFYVDSDHDYSPYESAKSEERAWLFTFGVYTPPGVLVYSQHLEDALEYAAASGHAGGAMSDGPDYDEAQEDLGYAGDFDDLPVRQRDEVRENAEADMTHTESGWLVSWEWSVNELDHGTPLYGAGVAAWVRANPDWIDDDDDVIIRTLQDAGADEKRIDAALAAVRANDAKIEVSVVRRSRW